MVARAIVAILASLMFVGCCYAQDGSEVVSPFYGYSGRDNLVLLKDNQRGVRGNQHRSHRSGSKVCTVPDEVNGGRVEVSCNDSRQYCETYIWSERKQEWVLNPKCDLSQKAPPGFYRGTGQYYRPDRNDDNRRADRAVREDRRVTPSERPERVVKPQERTRLHGHTDQRIPTPIQKRDGR